MIKLGLMFVNSGPFAQPDLLAHLAKTAEERGFESLWTVEHVVIPHDYKTPYPYARSGKIPGGEDVAIPDPLLPLAYAAAVTSRRAFARPRHPGHRQWLAQGGVRRAGPGFPSARRAHRRGGRRDARALA